MVIPPPLLLELSEGTMVIPPPFLLELSEGTIPEMCWRSTIFYSLASLLFLKTGMLKNTLLSGKHTQLHITVEMHLLVCKSTTASTAAADSKWA